MARPNLSKNVKFKKLVRVLKIAKPYVHGLLETMWETAHENGNPVLGDPDSVEAAAEWPGKPGVFFAAVRDCGFIDEESGKWIVHDYFDHAPEYVMHRHEKEAERKVPKQCEECGLDYRSTERHSKYCSSRCRNSAWRASQDAARRGGKTADDSQVKGNEGDISSCDALRRTETEPSVFVTQCDEPPAPAPAPAPQSEGVSPSEPPPQPAAQVVSPPASTETAAATENATAAAATSPSTKPSRKPRKPKEPRKPRERDPLFDTIAEMTGTDPNVSGPYIGKVCAALRRGDPPYTPEDVRRLPEALLARGLDVPFTLGVIEKWIGSVRSIPIKSRSPPKSLIDQIREEGMGFIANQEAKHGQS